MRDERRKKNDEKKMGERKMDFSPRHRGAKERRGMKEWETGDLIRRWLGVSVLFTFNE
jgi:hypothetical protein